MRYAFFVSALCLLMASPAASQQAGHGAGRGTMQRSGQTEQTGQRGLGQQTQSQQRLRIHTNQQQQQQAHTCTQSMQQVRTRLRTMSRISASKPLTPGQAKQWREQLQSEVQAMNREQIALNGSLTPEQKLAIQDRQQQMETSRQHFDSLLEALDMSLALETPDPARIRQQARDAESAMNKLRTQQQEINTRLGVEE